MEFYGPPLHLLLVGLLGISGFIFSTPVYDKDKTTKGLTYCRILFRNFVQIGFFFTNEFNSEKAETAATGIYGHLIRDVYKVININT